MSGRITQASIDAVREAVPIEDVISAYVTLRRAGGGSLKGLCPFHDEKSPSFHVHPAKKYFHCFGCGVGGDTFRFLQEIEGLGFGDVVERLADQWRIPLERESGPQSSTDNSIQRQRKRLIEANAAASDFYQAQLSTPEAQIARTFLKERAFDQAAAERFGCGYAPQGWDNLHNHLTGRGFTNEELVAAGLCVTNQSGGVYDRFRGRLLWPIRSQAGDIIGFGARRLYETDEGPKYLNTPETLIYKKNQVLYGIDTARRHIGAAHRVVVVEGYTDVMACHLAGVTTAVATCGTAFGDEHARILRRLLGDFEGGGDVIYTFDGDEAGQKAALRTFNYDQQFQAHTSVAVAADGMDPCDLRLRRGDGAVRELLEAREPLVGFVLKAEIAKFDQSTVEGRVQAATAAGPILSQVSDPDILDYYIRQVSLWTGIPRDRVRSLLTQPTGAPDNSDSTLTPTLAPGTVFEVAPQEYEVLSCCVADSMTVALARTDLSAADFIHPATRSLWTAIVNAYDSPRRSTLPWIGLVEETVREDPTSLALLQELAVTEQHSTTAQAAVLTLAQISIERRLARVEQSLGDLSLASDEVAKRLGSMQTLIQRRAEINERQQQILARL